MPADEFETIAKLFAPLAGEGARGLRDDAALFAGHVVTTDAIVEGVHFLPDDPIDTIAKKALRVNLSDLAAKGAAPVAALVTLIWPDARPASQLPDFARGLGEDLRAFGLALLGGDTTSTSGPLTISVTAFGRAFGPRTPARADATCGDDIWITGTIGDAYLGLRALRGAFRPSEALRAHVVARYQAPEPRLAFAAPIARFAGASMDVSDGLAQDAEKIAAASGADLNIEAARIPLSAAGRSWIAGGGALADLIGAGDDYEILFTSPPSNRGELETAARAANIAVTRIGAVAAGEGATILGADGASLPIRGYRHKLGS